MANPKRALFELGIIGASARAAAFSAIRAGGSVAASDAFGDADLRAAARYHEPEGSYPGGLAGALSRMPDAPFAYTGGLENRPDLVERLARLRPLWGNPPDVLRSCRDPFLLARVLGNAGVPSPDTRRADDPPRSLEGWLRKPIGGTGGRGIAPAREAPRRIGEPAYYQREARGLPCSALYAAFPGGALLLGATRQLVGEPWLHAPRFAWCGAVGPLALPRAAAAALRRAGVAVADAFGLRGIFGLDFILDDGRPQPVELNPRYTASAEVLEHALGFSAMGLHRDAFAAGAVPRAPAGQPSRTVLGKAVLFAPRPLVAAGDLLSSFAPDPFLPAPLADVPGRGTRIERGRPLISLFAKGPSERECVDALRAAAEGILRHFQPACRFQEGPDSQEGRDATYCRPR